MEKRSILNILKSSGVKEEDMVLFNDKLKDKRFTIDDCDKLLVKLGYEKLFVLDDENFDEDYDNYDDFEPIQHRKSLED